MFVFVHACNSNPAIACTFSNIARNTCIKVFMYNWLLNKCISSDIYTVLHAHMF